MDNDQLVRNATEERSVLGLSDELGRFVARGDLDMPSDVRMESKGRSIRWGKVRAQGGSLFGGSYGTFGDSEISLNHDDYFGKALLLREYWYWIVLILVLVIMGFANWYGFGLGGELALTLL
jgi:hypothetical protein